MTGPTPEFDWRHAAILRMLLYPVQFDTCPLKGIDGVLAREMFAGHSELFPNDPITAIDAGLASDAKLFVLIPINHPEEVIRDYFATIRSRLVAKSNRYG